MQVRAIIAIAVVAALAPAAAGQAASFDGNCEFSGSVSFTPPMTNVPQPIAQSADAPGTCSGTFVDGRRRAHTLDGAPGRSRASSSGDAVSCAFGLASGAGRLIFGSRWSVGFFMNEYRAGA